MNKFLKKGFISLALLGAVSSNCFSQDSGQSAFVEGCLAYSEEQWESAVFLLKKSVAFEENLTPDVYYMLISSEINSSEYENALNDCEFFLNNFGDSAYASRIQYYKGKILYALGDYDKSVVVLSDFCHQNSDDDMYSYALFYIGEAFYAAYKYEDASSIYERVIADYPESEMFAAAQYRIESIAQRVREEKLLYLLKQTGEEYLSAKEEYEKQLRMYNSETASSTRKRLVESQQKNEELERHIKELEEQLAELTQNIETANANLVEVQKEKEDVQKKAAEEIALRDSQLQEIQNSKSEKESEQSEPEVVAKGTAEVEKSDSDDVNENLRREADILRLKSKAMQIQLLMNNSK